MKILVTGGAGYIGSILVPRLLALKHQVTVLDNLMYKQISLISYCHNKNFDFISGDVRNNSLLKDLIQKHDVIIPLACLVGAPLSEKDPWQAEAVNKDAVINCYKFKSSSQQLIYPCTNSGYGVGQEGIFCTEKSPLNPLTVYGKTKVAAENFILENGEGVTFRLATVFGASARMRLDLLVNDFVYRAVNDKSIVLFEADFKRNYLHIIDAADAFIFAINNYEKLKGQAYNIGLSEANLSKQELCLEIKKKIPNFTIIKSEIGEDPDKRNYIVSNQKIESMGFKALTTLSDGIEELIKVFSILKRNEYSNY